VRNTVLYALLPLTVFALIVVIGFWFWRRYGSTDNLSQMRSRNLPSPVEIMPCPVESSLGQIQLLEVKAHGRFGCVWRAQTSTGCTVAVKVFPLHDQQSWLTERDFYGLSQIRCHDNVLRFFGSDRRGNEFWLVTEYHDRGSLYDHLKGNVVSMVEAVTIALTMCRGLAFLHSSYSDKPIVAHRDFKSRNVLLNSDFTVCVADFGLALILDQHPGDVHGQVRTDKPS
jgi:serine/threonine protein kinase